MPRKKMGPKGAGPKKGAGQMSPYAKKAIEMLKKKGARNTNRELYIMKQNRLAKKKTTSPKKKTRMA
tara:strand:+ start:50 stop:250 length:201 start_codon:yes stop_codon:yes gene_type:complete